MKKLMALMLIGTMTFSLVACGNDKKDNESTETTVTESTEQMNTEQTNIEQTDTEQETVNENEENINDNNSDSADAETTGNTLLNAFTAYMEANPQATAQEVADEILGNEIIPFSGTSMPVEEGLLTGFGNAEITGFSEGVMFSPMIGSIPFVGYVFVLEDGADMDGFVTTLKDNADQRWNVCTEAEETVVEYVGNTVFFVMCPRQMDE